MATVNNPSPDAPGTPARPDPAMLAERRARRAELAEEASRARLREAEAQLAVAQAQLAAAHDQRTDLAARLKQAERDLRAARQGEYAEGRLRAEVQEEAAAAARIAAQEHDELRAAFTAAQLRIGELEDDLARAERAHDAAAATPEEIAGADAQIVLLQFELDRRLAAQDAVSAELQELRAQLAGTTTQLREQAEREAAATRALADSLRREQAERARVETVLTQRCAELEAAVLTEREALEAVGSRLGGALAALADRHARELAAARTPPAAARPQVEGALAQLRDELARLGETVAAGEGEELRRLRAELDARAVAIAQAEARVVELEDELEASRVALRPAPALPPADHPALVVLGDARAPVADAVIVDLARAAARLRATQDEEIVTVAPVPAAAPADPSAAGSDTPARRRLWDRLLRRAPTRAQAG